MNEPNQKPPWFKVPMNGAEATPKKSSEEVNIVQDPMNGTVSFTLRGRNGRSSGAHV